VELLLGRTIVQKSGSVALLEFTNKIGRVPRADDKGNFFDLFALLKKVHNVALVLNWNSDAKHET